MMFELFLVYLESQATRSRHLALPTSRIFYIYDVYYLFIIDW